MDLQIENGVLVKYLGKGGEVTLPEGVTVIGEGAFRGCERLSGIAFPDGVAEIRDAAFRDCISLTSLFLPNGVRSIRHEAFLGCTGLRKISFGGQIWDICDDAFPQDPFPAVEVRERPGQVLTTFLHHHLDSWRDVAFPGLRCLDVPVRAREFAALHIAEDALGGAEIPEPVYHSYLKYLAKYKENWLSRSDGDARLLVQLILREKLIPAAEIGGIIQQVSQRNDRELLHLLTAYREGVFHRGGL